MLSGGLLKGSGPVPPVNITKLLSFGGTTELVPFPEGPNQLQLIPGYQEATGRHYTGVKKFSMTAISLMPTRASATPLPASVRTPAPWVQNRGWGV
jgi:hypothetical protein